MGYYLGKGTAGRTAVPVEGGTRSLADILKGGTSLLGGSSSSPTGDSEAKPRIGPGQFRQPVTKKASGDAAAENVFGADWNNIEEIGDWQWPAEMRGLYDLIQSRAGSLLHRTPGFSPEALAEMFGSNFEKIRGAERGTREEVENTLASQGMLNTGTALDALGKVAMETEKNVGGAKQQMFLANEQQKRTDEQLYNELASNYFNQLMNYAATEEGLNAARRGEANNMLAMLLQYYMGSMGSQGG